MNRSGVTPLPVYEINKTKKFFGNIDLANEIPLVGCVTLTGLDRINGNLYHVFFQSLNQMDVKTQLLSHHESIKGKRLEGVTIIPLEFYLLPTGVVTNGTFDFFEMKSLTWNQIITHVENYGEALPDVLFHCGIGVEFCYS